MQALGAALCCDRSPALPHKMPRAKFGNTCKHAPTHTQTCTDGAETDHNTSQVRGMTSDQQQWALRRLGSKNTTQPDEQIDRMPAWAKRCMIRTPGDICEPTTRAQAVSRTPGFPSRRPTFSATHAPAQATTKRTSPTSPPQMAEAANVSVPPGRDRPHMRPCSCVCELRFGTRLHRSRTTAAGMTLATGGCIL